MHEPRLDSSLRTSAELGERNAARWALRLADGLSPEAEAELADWLAVDPRHVRLLAEYRTAWERFAPLAGEAAREAPDPDRFAPRLRHAPIWRFAIPALAAAAALAFGLWWRSSPAPVAAPALAGLGAHFPPPCEQRTLADGSIVELNRGADIAVEFTADLRRIRLSRGEAAFAVAKDAARPFVVTAGTVALRAVGTAFNVRLETAAVEVLVTEGRVAVVPDARPRTTDHGPWTKEELDGMAGARDVPASNLRPPPSDFRPLVAGTFVAAGERVIIPLAPTALALQVESLSSADIEALLAWQSRLLEFDDVPLADIVAAFNRRNPVTLRIDDPALAAQRMTTSFRSSNVEGFVRLLEGNYGIRATPRPDGTVVLRR